MGSADRILWAVRGGCDTAIDVAARTGLDPTHIYTLARRLVLQGLLCALDYAPWCVTYEGALRTQRLGWRS